MKKMKDYQYVRLARFRYGQSIRKISRDTGIARPTIRKILEGEEPKYNLSKTKEKPVMAPYLETIKGWLLADKDAPVKQRHTARRIYDRLKDEYGFKGSNSIVRKTVRELKEDLDLVHYEAFIPSDPEKRSGIEMDWGEMCLELDGKRKKMYMFCMRAKYSGKIFVKIYPVMIQECFFNGHIEAFCFFGGVFGEVVYDNLKTAVQKVLRGKGRVEQTAFVSFRSYYCYEATFCNTRKGNEKGGIEGCVGFVRRNFLTPMPKCKSLSELNDYLLEKCKARDNDKTHGRKLTIGELFEQERSQLQVLPQRPYNNYKLIETLVDKHMTVKIHSNRYSVPQRYVNKRVIVELGLYDVRITYKDRLIAEHNREFQRHKWVLDPWHYLQLLQRKTRAFKGSRVLTVIENQWDPIIKKLWEIQVGLHGQTEGTKEFLEIVLFFENKDYSEMVTVIDLAIENATTNKESIKMLYESLTEMEVKKEPAEIQSLSKISQLTLPVPDVSKFDLLMEAAAHG